MGRATALVEVVIAAAVVIGHNVYRVVPNEVIVLLIVGFISLAIRRQSFRTIGFRRPHSWQQTILIAICAAVLLQLLSIYVTEPLISRFTNQPSDLSQFRDIVGNVGVAACGFRKFWRLDSGNSGRLI